PLIHFVFGHVIAPWHRPVRDNERHLHAAYEGGLEVGELTAAEYGLMGLALDSAFRGDPIDTSRDLCARYFQFFRDVKKAELSSTYQGRTLLVLHQPLLCLQGKTRARASLDTDDFSEAAHVAALSNPSDVFFFHVYKLQAAVLLGDLDAALAAARGSERTLGQ